jgi:hypothetical protein
MKNFILRIYHAGKDIDYDFVGVIEEVGVNGRKAFHGFKELREIFASGGILKSIKEVKGKEKGRAANKTRRDRGKS